MLKTIVWGLKWKNHVLLFIAQPFGTKTQKHKQKQQKNTPLGSSQGMPLTQYHSTSQTQTPPPAFLDVYRGSTCLFLHKTNKHDEGSNRIPPTWRSTGFGDLLRLSRLSRYHQYCAQRMLLIAGSRRSSSLPQLALTLLLAFPRNVMPQRKLRSIP